MNTSLSRLETKWEGRWDELSGKIQKNWGKLTNDEIAETEGDISLLIGKIKEKYAESVDNIEQTIQSWK